MTTIYLVRHAEAEGNLYRRVHGWYNSRVTEKGWRQIAALERRFQTVPVDAVYSSDMYRTMATAQAVYRPKGLTLHTTPGLREAGMGEWEDLPWGEVARRDLPSLRTFMAGDPSWGSTVPGCESFQTVLRRVWSSIREIAAGHPDQTVAIFCHGMAIRAVLNYCHGRPIEEMKSVPHSDNTGVACLTVDGGRVTVVHDSDASHLSNELSTFYGQRWWKSQKDALLDANMWFRPLDMETEGEFYRQCRREAWVASHGSMDHFDGQAFYEAALRNAREDPHGISCAMLDGQVMGILQLDFRRDAREQAGWIPFYYMTPEGRGRGLGIQLLGEAVSRFRALGREVLRLRCAPENAVAQKFYLSHGFRKVGEDPASPVPLDIMEKYIGYHDL